MAIKNPKQSLQDNSNILRAYWRHKYEERWSIIK